MGITVHIFHPLLGRLWKLSTLGILERSRKVP